MFLTVFRTRLGWMALAGSAAGLRRIVLPRARREMALGLALDGTIEPVEDTSFFGDLPRRFCRYFDGEPVHFDDQVDVSGATAFERATWAATRDIPYGETRSYAWVAQRAGKPRAARAVGQALSRNPLPVVVPCHRVVRADGGLGGFSEGLETKKRLLSIEAGGKLRG